MDDVASHHPPELARRHGDHVEITLRDVYDVTQVTAGKVDGLTITMGQVNKDADDHEIRLRLLEQSSWKTTAALWVAAIATTGTVTLGILRVAGVDVS